jgi:rhamnosyltransferase
VADNSACESFAGTEIGKMTYVPLMENTGIAHAQNVSIQHILLNSHFKYILFLDQDSRFSNNFPLRMAEEHEKMKTVVPNLAMLGPIVVNKDTGDSYKSCFHDDKQSENGFIVRREIISSGSIVDRECLEHVGGMLDSLFIDFVDFEWCWRAKKKEYMCGITANISLNHKVGVNMKKIGNYSLMIWKPFRYFYQYRNYLWLSRTDYTPWQWRIATGVKFMLRLFYFPLLVSDGWQCWKKMLRGIACSFKGYSEFRKEIEEYG